MTLDEEGNETTMADIVDKAQQPLNQYQTKQIEYLDKQVQLAAEKHWDNLDIGVECKDCQVVVKRDSIENIKAFITGVHRGHKTWTTNNRFQGQSNNNRPTQGYKKSGDRGGYTTRNR